MNSVQALKLSIILQWALFFTAIFVGYFEEFFLPEQLQLYLSLEVGKELSAFDIFILGLAVLILIGLSDTSYYIYRLTPWSRKPYTYLTLVEVLFSFSLAPTIETPISSTLLYMESITVGFTLALLYFSQASTYFEKHL